MKNSLGSDKDKQACASKSQAGAGNTEWLRVCLFSFPPLHREPPGGLQSQVLVREVALGFCTWWKRLWGSVQPRGNSSAMRPWKSILPLLFQGRAHELRCSLYDLGWLLSRMPRELCTTRHHHRRIQRPLGNLAYLAMHYQVRTALTVPVTPAGRSKRFSFFRFPSNCKLRYAI